MHEILRLWTRNFDFVFICLNIRVWKKKINFRWSLSLSLSFLHRQVSVNVIVKANNLKKVIHVCSKLYLGLVSVREQSTLDLFVDLRVSEVSRLFTQLHESLDLLVDHRLKLVAVCWKEIETSFSHDHFTGNPIFYIQVYSRSC